VIHVLGINMSHYSSACLYRDGELIAAVPEERLNRVKFSAAFPEKSILKVLEIAGLQPEEVDQVAIGTRCEMFDSNLAQSGEYRKTTRAVSLASRLLPIRFVESDFLKKFYIHTLGAVRRRQFMTRYLPFFKHHGFQPGNLVYYDHHTCHAAAAYYLSPGREKTLVLTCDGNGDGDCGSVWIAEGNTLDCKLRIPSIHSLGGLVSRTAKFMGMAPWQDEYKVMGLAPWGEKDRAQPVVEKFRTLWAADGLGYRNLCGYAGDALVNHLRRTFPSVRFDYMAYGIQKLLEEILSSWVDNNAVHYGVDSLAFAGGVFLNVKANKRITELDSVRESFWFPAAGDDSIAIGAGILGTLALQRKKHIEPDIKPISDVYWGEPIDNAIEAFVKNMDCNGFSIETPPDIDHRVAELLADNHIVARCTGRMEYGPRALGNRSILSNPSDIENVQKLNDMIKCRDFWMPFAGTIIDTAAPRYLVNEKKFPSPYMILSFDTHPETRHEIKAATHQADGTIRPQILTQNMNPSYYKLIQVFEQKTGIGGLLNTSLNLHGDPMVNLPEEAFYVLQNSALTYLALGKYLIKKDIPENR
jgi:carbamoyltransferase